MSKKSTTKSSRKSQKSADRCATPRCRGKVVIQHLGKGLCQKCWDKVSAEQAEAPTAPSQEVTVPPTGKKPVKKRDGMSGLDAAVLVLTEAGQPMACKPMVEAMLAKGLWKTGGKTPAATIYSAILREISTKGEQSRFTKTERGHFTVNA